MEQFTQRLTRLRVYTDLLNEMKEQRIISAHACHHAILKIKAEKLDLTNAHTLLYPALPTSNEVQELINAKYWSI